MTLKEISVVMESYKELVTIAKKLHHLDEVSCNYGLSPRQEKRIEKLEKEAQQIVDSFGFHLIVYHQSDPRGGTLYLCTNKEKYYEGVCVS